MMTNSNNETDFTPPKPMKTASMILKGELVQVEAGEYSDYTVLGAYRALETFSPDALIAEWLSMNPKQAAAYNFSDTQFWNWIVNEKKLVKEVKTRIWHLTDYSNAAEMFVR